MATREFRVTHSSHSLDKCQPCVSARESAIGTARVTGSVGATHTIDRADHPVHSVTVTRLSPAEEARREADASGNHFAAAFADLLNEHGISDSDEIVIKLDQLLDQLRADEYEAGYATGYVQHPGNAR